MQQTSPERGLAKFLTMITIVYKSKNYVIRKSYQELSDFFTSEGERVSKLKEFHHRATFPCTVEELYQYHSRPGALERLLPPWDGSRVIRKEGSIAPGGKVLMHLKQGPFTIPWEAHHIAETPGVMFRDVQHKGPFATFRHTHRFSSTTNGSRLDDSITFALPGQRFLPAMAERQVKTMLHRIFTYREHVLREDLKLHSKYSRTPLRILISGASGVLGSALVPLLTTGGHQVWTLVRRKPSPGSHEIYWNPQNGELNPADIPEIDAVIHLAGEYIGVGRWGEEQRQRVVESRILGTELLAKTVAALPVPPKVFLSASAVGFYGNRHDTLIDEREPAGDDFVSSVCEVWEKSTWPASNAGIRTVLMRFGVGLTPRGGALQRLLVSRAIGFIRYFGSGDQYVSWMSVDDMVAAMLHCLVTEEVAGPVNIAAPNPVTNRELMAGLAKVLNRPLLLPIPSKLLEILHGQMAHEIVLSGCRASVKKLVDTGFEFRHPDLESAFTVLLGKSAGASRFINQPSGVEQ